MDRIKEIKLSSIETENQSFEFFLRKTRDTTETRIIKKRSNSVSSLNSDMIDDDMMSDDSGIEQVDLEDNLHDLQP